MSGRKLRRSARCASNSKLSKKIPKKNQKQKVVKDEPDAQVEIDAIDNPTQSTSSSSGVRTLAALLPLPDSDVTVSGNQLSPEQVEKAALLATSVFYRQANKNIASSSGLTKQYLGKIDRRQSSGPKLGKSLSIQLKASNKPMLPLNKKLLAKDVRSSTLRSSLARGAKYYRIKKPVDVKKDASTNTAEPWIVADPPERAPFDVCFKDKPADEDFSEDARRIVANLYDFFTQLGFVDPWKETLDATRISSKQFLKIRAELTKVSHDHHY